MKKIRNCEKIFMQKKIETKNGGLTFDFKFIFLIFIQFFDTLQTVEFIILLLNNNNKKKSKKKSIAYTNIF